MANVIPDVSLIDNSDERLPIVLVLDCSGSMDGERISRKDTPG
jgi:Mg-chelatase subunit ChlD